MSEPSNCPFCNDALDINRFERDQYKCGTLKDSDAERYRTHMCYQNEIKNLKTGGETDYSEGWLAGLDAAFSAMADAKSSWKVKNPPMRRT